MNISAISPPLRFCGQTFLFAWRMGLFFSPAAVIFAANPFNYLVAGRVAFLLAGAGSLVALFLWGRAHPTGKNGKIIVGIGAIAASAGTLLALAGSSLVVESIELSTVGFSIAGIGDSLLFLGFGKMYVCLSVRLSMRAVPIAMASSALLYAVIVNNAVAIAVPFLVLLPVACAAVLFHDIDRRVASGSLQEPPPSLTPAPEPERSTFTKWRISMYTAVLWFSFGVMWPLAVARLFTDSPIFLAFSLSVAALVVIVSVVLAALTYVLRLPVVKTFWIFVPLTFAGVTAVAVIDSNIQVLAFAMVFAAHNIAEVQLITHFSALCRRRGYSSRMLFGCGFAILGMGEAIGLLVGAAIVPYQSTALMTVLLVCANAIVIAVIFSIMRVNTRFQKAELEAALAKQVIPVATSSVDQSSAAGEEVPADCASDATAATGETEVIPLGQLDYGVSEGAKRSGLSPTEVAELWGDTFGLSAREKEVAALLLSGRNVPAVAEMLCISQSTVQTHVKHIYEKVGVRTRQELIAKGSEPYHT